MGLHLYKWEKNLACKRQKAHNSKQGKKKEEMKKQTTPCGMNLRHPIAVRTLSSPFYLFRSNADCEIYRLCEDRVGKWKCSNKSITLALLLRLMRVMKRVHLRLALELSIAEQVHRDELIMTTLILRKRKYKSRTYIFTWNNHVLLKEFNLDRTMTFESEQECLKKKKNNNNWRSKAQKKQGKKLGFFICPST